MLALLWRTFAVDADHAHTKRVFRFELQDECSTNKRNAHPVGRNDRNAQGSSALHIRRETHAEGIYPPTSIAIVRWNGGGTHEVQHVRDQGISGGVVARNN